MLDEKSNAGSIDDFLFDLVQQIHYEYSHNKKVFEEYLNAEKKYIEEAQDDVTINNKEFFQEYQKIREDIYRGKYWSLALELHKITDLSQGKKEIFYEDQIDLSQTFKYSLRMQKKVDLKKEMNYFLKLSDYIRTNMPEALKENELYEETIKKLKL